MSIFNLLSVQSEDLQVYSTKQSKYLLDKTYFPVVCPFSKVFTFRVRKIQSKIPFLESMQYSVSFSFYKIL